MEQVTGDARTYQTVGSHHALALVEKKAVIDAGRFQELDARIRELTARTQEIKNRGYWMRQFTNTTRDLAELQEESLKIGQEFHQLLQASIAFGVRNNQYVRQLSEALVNLEDEQRGASGEYLAAAKEVLTGLANTEEDLLAKIAHLASEAATTKAILEVRIEEGRGLLTAFSEQLEELKQDHVAEAQSMRQSHRSMQKNIYWQWAAMGALACGLLAAVLT